MSPCKRSGDDGLEEDEEEIVVSPVAVRPTVAPKPPLKLPPLPLQSPVVYHASLFHGHAHATTKGSHVPTPCSSERTLATFDSLEWNEDGEWTRDVLNTSAPNHRCLPPMQRLRDDESRARTTSEVLQPRNVSILWVNPQDAAATKVQAINRGRVARKAGGGSQPYSVANVTAAVIEMDRSGAFSQRGIRLVCGHVQRAKAIAASQGKQDPDSVYFERCALAAAFALLYGHNPTAPRHLR